MNRKRTRQVTILKVSQNYYVVVPNDLIKLQSVIFAIYIQEELKIMVATRIMVTAGTPWVCIGLVLSLLTLIMNCKCVMY